MSDDESTPPPPSRSTIEITKDDCLNLINSFINNEKPGLRTLFDEEALHAKAADAAAMANKIYHEHPKLETAMNCSLLTLYDVVLLLDDSTSMVTAESGTRVKALTRVIETIASIVDMANPDGILSVRWLNGAQGKRNVTQNKVAGLLESHNYYGLTQIGTALSKKVLQRFVWERPAKKPLLVMVVTDGEVEGEREDLLKDVIKDCVKRLRSDPNRVEEAVAFHFSHIGNDKSGKAMVEALDNDKDIGHLIDCFPADKNLEQISDPAKKWDLLPKLLLGSIMKAYDAQDEGAKFDVGPSELETMAVDVESDVD